MKKMVAQLADLLEQVALMPRRQRMQDAQPQLPARLSRTIGSTKGSHVVLFTASKWQSRHPHQKNSYGGAPEWVRACRLWSGDTQCARPQRGAILNGSAGARGKGRAAPALPGAMPSPCLRRGSAKGASPAKKDARVWPRPAPQPQFLTSAAPSVQSRGR